MNRGTEVSRFPCTRDSVHAARHFVQAQLGDAEALIEAIREEGGAVPARVREAALRLSGSLTQPPSPNRDS